MERPPMDEWDKPDFIEEEVSLVWGAVKVMKERMNGWIGAPKIPRKSVLELCDLAEKLRALAGGNPEPLKRFLGIT